jgi:hypothetical protein
MQDELADRCNRKVWYDITCLACLGIWVSLGGTERTQKTNVLAYHHISSLKRPLRFDTYILGR